MTCGLLLGPSCLPEMYTVGLNLIGFILHSSIIALISPKNNVFMNKMNIYTYLDEDVAS